MNKIRVEIKDRLPSSMQDELEDNQEDYFPLTHEYWCDLLSTIEVKDKRESAATHIKKIYSDRESYISDRNGSVRIPRKKKARTGVLCSNKGTHNKAPKHHSTQRLGVFCNKAGIPEQKYMLYNSGDCFGKHTNHKTIKYGLGIPIGSRYEAVKQYNKYRSKRRKEIKAPKNQNKMLFRITKKSGSCHELKKTKNIREMDSKKRCDSSSEFSGAESDSDSSLSNDID